MLAVCLAVSALAYAPEDLQSLDFAAAEGFRSVLTGLDGERVTVDGVLDTTTLSLHPACEYLTGYEVWFKGERVMAVTFDDVAYTPTDGLGAGQVQALHGWYSVEFSMDDTHVCFLAGLTARNLFAVQEELVAARLEDRYFAMTNVDFIDAEKNYIGDSQLCWAASTSDILAYTGWGQKAGFDDADDIFEAFIASFSDEGGNPLYAVEWFFNGLDRPQDNEWSGWSWSKQYDGSFTGYLPDYEGNAVADYINIMNRPVSRMGDTFDHLRDGWGVSILIGWYRNGYRTGGHLITLWGYIEDTAASGRERYPALIISDSDSDIVTGAERRDAPNRYRLLMADPYDEFDMDTYALDYDENTVAILEDFCALMPYSDDIERETAGTKNKFTTPDLIPNGIDVYFVDWIEDIGCLAGLPFSVRPYLYNHSQADAEGPLGYLVEVFDVDGTLKSSQNGVYTGKIAALSAAEADPVYLDALDAGEYTVVLTVNADSSIEEAYTSNNTASYTITVVQSPVDTSGVSFTLGEMYYGDVVHPLVADVTYEGMDELEADYTEAFLFLSYLENGKWSPIEYTYDPYNSDGLPDKCVVEARGEQVKAVLLLEPNDAEEPFIVIQSEPVDAVYDSIAIVVSENSTKNFSDIDAGDTGLNRGEKIAFSLKNVSTAGNDLEYNMVEVYAANEADQFFLYTTAYDHYTLSGGESSEEFVVTEFRDDLYEIYEEDEMAGEFTLKAVVIGPWGTSEAEIGTIYVKGSKVIFYSVACDVDGISASFEVTAYVPYVNSDGNPDGNMCVYYEDEDGSSGITYLSYTDKLGRDLYIFHMQNSTVTLRPETTYSFYPVFRSYSEGYSYGYDQGDTFETESLDSICETLWLDETASGTLTNGERHFYSFTPSVGGAYVFKGQSSNYANFYYLTDSGSWDSFLYVYSYSEGAFEKTLNCEAGRTLYLYVTGAGKYAVTVEKGKDFAEAFSAPTLTLSNDDYFSVTGIASAEIPYGADFYIYLDYGAEDNYETTSDWYYNYTSGTVTIRKDVTAMPGESVSMRARVQDMETDTEYAGPWQSMKPKTPKAETLTLGVTAAAELEEMGAAWYTFTAPKDGLYFSRFSGEFGGADMLVSGEWHNLGSVNPWGSGQESGSVKLEGGTTYYVRVMARTAGTYSLTILTCGVQAGDYDTSDFTAVMSMSAVVPENYTGYYYGVEYCDSVLREMGSPNTKTLQKAATAGGEVEETFTASCCPGCSLYWRAFLRNPETGDEYTTGWMYLGGWMRYTELKDGDTQTVTLEDGSGFFRFAPQEDNLFAVTGSGSGGVLLRWDPAKLAWEEAAFSSGHDAVLTFTPTYYSITYAAGGVEAGCRAEYFRLLVTDGESAAISLSATKETASAVTTGEASAESLCADLSLTAQLGYGANVRLGVAYGLTRDALNYVWGELPEEAADAVSLTLTAQTLPSSDYVWRAVGFDGKTGRYFYGEWKTFTTKATDTEVLALDTLTEEKDEAFYRFEAPRDGVYTLTASGEEVALTVFGADGTRRQYTLDAEARAVSFKLDSGETVYIEQKGSTRLLMTNGFTYVEYAPDDLTEVKVHLVPEEDAVYIVACYDANGRQLAYKFLELEAGNAEVITLKAGETVSYVKIFRLDGNKGFAPKCPAIAAAAPGA